MGANQMGILTLDEAKGADVFWYESRCVYDSDFGRVGKLDGVTVAIERMGRSGFAFEDGRDYGSAWRCWNMKPTDEQRKAVPWKEVE